ncbi:MAG: hypothetical protein IJK77_03685 [Lachnospiraceae bacterium]|nr:hypothetical protein [Lachnospiraceae bacterium]
MGLFGNKKKNKEPQYQTFRISMNTSGKAADGATETLIIREDCEFNAIRAAEKQRPRLKVCKSERIDAETE